jgi:hypothetical protein
VGNRGEPWGTVYGKPWGTVYGKPWGKVYGEPWGTVYGKQAALDALHNSSRAGRLVILLIYAELLKFAKV